ncbi:class III extradiol ring-cleavage dioxygenase [Simiduia curdlanivorans]|uniref:DODA-type extradiol aromatic ring-opening family dioxygenase n=1 Tax=Simiduia curdlanivorans TaxID=1492769 RepID=A0ABV8V662_9GAMM|nr:class III extradiol ring-cleavage dioxygenase [Simiduia curdlanivorans]MDN3638701.1 class III extradiol ring-cleavage dioxygenase [Simiduia curdlanivorans]
MTKLAFPVAFVSHGGGPLPLMGDADHRELVAACAQLRQQLPDNPSAIIVISAHWESRGFAVTSQPEPPLLFDYSGFPEQTYRYQYGAKGEPELAVKLQSALATKNIALRLDANRGFDHGVFVPLMLMYPEADIPVLELSIDCGLSAREHLMFGQKLAEVLPPDVLVLGSGFSFHNLPAFFAQKTTQSIAACAEFNTWLNHTLVDSSISAEARLNRLDHWSDAPQARFCHPREEHLMPLLVCAAMTKAPAQALPFSVMGYGAQHYLWLREPLDNSGAALASSKFRGLGAASKAYRGLSRSRNNAHGICWKPRRARPLAAIRCVELLAKG